MNRDEATMNERHPAPAPLRGLRLLPGDTKADTAGPGTVGPEGDTSAAPVPDPALPAVPGAVTPITMPERVGTAVRRLPGTVAKTAGELWLYPDRLIHFLVRAAPDSTPVHWEYAKSGEWVPRELHGTRTGKAVMTAGLLYHAFAVAADKALQGLESGARKARWVVQRPLRLLCVLVPILILVLLFAL
jgi:hypothetical protein